MSIFTSKHEKSYKEYCLIGLNRFNVEIGQILMREGHKVTALDLDQKKVDTIGSQFHYAIVCDSTSINDLKEVGVQFFDYVILGITDMETSVVTAANLRELSVPNVMCKAKDEKHRRILQFMGINISFIPEEEVATKIAFRAMYDLNVEWFSYNEKSRDTLIIKIPITNADLWDKKISEIDFIKQVESIVISIDRENGEMKVPVGAGDVICRGDTICILCNKKYAKKIKSYFNK